MSKKLFVEAVSISLISLTSSSVLASSINNNGPALSSVDVVISGDSPILGEIISLVSGAPGLPEMPNGGNGVVSFSGNGTSVSTTAGAQGEVTVNVNNSAQAGDNSSVNAIVNINVYVHGGGPGTSGGFFQGGSLTNEMGGITSALPADCGGFAGSQGCWQITQTETTYPLESGISTSNGENIPFATPVDPSIQGATVMPTVPVVFSPPPPAVVVPPSPAVVVPPTTNTQIPQSSSVLNGSYQAGGKTLSLSRITSKGSVSNAVLMGDISNSGWVSNSTIGEGATLTGGTLTGSIINEGTISNVDFRGSTIEGGTLNGTIDNSRGGTIKNVELGPNAHITGGKMAGTVTGDCTAPAVLEDVTITANSNVSCVSLDGSSVEEGAVVSEAGKELPEDIETPVTPEETVPPADITVEDTTTRSSSESSSVSPLEVSSDLPPLGKALAINKKGNAVESESTFAGGITVADEETFQQSNTVRKLQDAVNVKADILVDADDVGKHADILVYADYQATEDSEVFQLMLDEKGSYLIWDGEVASLEAFQSQVTLKAVQAITVYQGRLLETGILKITFGYRLEDGTVILSPETINLTVTGDE
jgi:hypothetical protein